MNPAPANENKDPEDDTGRPSGAPKRGRGRPIDPERENFWSAAERHIAEHGRRNWELLFDKFPSVNPKTRWKWLNQMATRPMSPESVEVASEVLTDQVEARTPVEPPPPETGAGLDPEARAGIIGTLPAAPSPNYIARHGPPGLRQLDFVAEIQKLYADAQMLREHAIRSKVNPDTGEASEAIANPLMFDRSIARRANILETSIKAVQEIWDLRMMQGFYEAIIAEIGLESPDCQRRIMMRLKALNARSGMTLESMMV